MHAERTAPSGRVLPAPFPGPQIIGCHGGKPNGRADAVFRTVFDSKPGLDARVDRDEASIVETWKRISVGGQRGTRFVLDCCRRV